MRFGKNQQKNQQIGILLSCNYIIFSYGKLIYDYGNITIVNHLSFISFGKYKNKINFYG